MADDKDILSSNQRKFPRKQVHADVTYQYRNLRLNRVFAGTGKTLNLSQTGALIRIENYLSPQAELDLYITTKDRRQLTTRCRVVHCHRISFNLFEVGVHFLKVSKGKPPGR